MKRIACAILFALLLSMAAVAAVAPVAPVVDGYAPAVPGQDPSL